MSELNRVALRKLAQLLVNELPEERVTGWSASGPYVSTDDAECSELLEVISPQQYLKTFARYFALLSPHAVLELLGDADSRPGDNDLLFHAGLTGDRKEDLEWVALFREQIAQRERERVCTAFEAWRVKHARNVCINHETGEEMDMVPSGALAVALEMERQS
jgi:hypothetical protein